MLLDLIKKNRSYRRFDAQHAISADCLKQLVELARLSPSAANLQPLKFHLSAEKELNDKIFPNTIWAGYLKDWHGPGENERPTAYITLLGDTSIAKSFDTDAGIASQSILLGATELGLGGCIFGSIKRDELRKILNIPAHMEILYVIALGKPVENMEIETAQNGNIKYYRDENQTHHVPKRPLEELIIDS